VVWSLLLFLGIQGRYREIYYDLTLTSPFDQIRSASKALFVGLIAILSFKAIFQGEKRQNLHLPVATFFILLLQCFFGIRFILDSDPYHGLLAPFIILMLILGLSLVFIKHYSGPGDIHNVLTCSQFAGMSFCLVSIHQYVIRPGSVLVGGRMTGISGNPNFAGIFLATLLLLSVYLLLSYGRTRAWRIWDLACIVLFSVFLFWSGSRTAAVLGSVGIVWLLRFKMNVWVFIIPLAMIAGLVVTNFGTEASDSLARLSSFEDTGRYRIWTNHLQIFLNDPIFGGYAITAIENSYLSIAGSTGVVGLLALFLAGIVHCKNVLYVWRHRDFLCEYKMLADLILAWTISFAIAACFEGFLLAIATAAAVFMIWLLTFASILADEIRNKIHINEN